jgi:uncharacterized protein YbjT (DUF2867 family)
MTIAVIGAPGNTGRAVVKELRALGQNPVCVVRNGDKAREVLGGDAKTAVAELTDRLALEKALAGVQSVFVVTGTVPAWSSSRTTCSTRRSKPASNVWYGSAAACGAQKSRRPLWR